jgi:hypothetical protein
MSAYDKRIDCLPILVGFPALGTLCDAARCGAAGPDALSLNNIEATLADWLTGRGGASGIPVSRDRTSVYMCRALLGGDPHVQAGQQAASFPDMPVETSPFPCVECAGNLDLAPRCPHGQLTSSVELGCGQIAVPIVGRLDLVR